MQHLTLETLGVSHRLDNLSSTSQTENEHLRLSEDIQRMRKKLNGVSKELPSYDRRVFESVRSVSGVSPNSN